MSDVTWLDGSPMIGKTYFEWRTTSQAAAVAPVKAVKKDRKPLTDEQKRRKYESEKRLTKKKRMSASQ